MEVPIKETFLSMDEMAPILRRAFAAEYGQDIGAAEPYLLAMLALENAHGLGLFNHNWGNVITWNANQPYWMDHKNGNPRHFRALNSHDEGARYFVQQLGTETNRRIIDAALRGDFGAFFRAITKRHPKTKRAYCADCDRPAVANTYRDLVREFGGLTRAATRAVKRDRARAGAGLFFLLTASAGAFFMFRKKRFA